MEKQQKKGFLGRRLESMKEGGKKMINAEEVKDNWNWIERGINWFKPKKLDLSKESVDFETAMRKGGIKSDEDLLGIYKGLRLKFLLSTCLLCIGSFISIGGLFYGNVKPFIGFIGFAALCLSSMFQASFIGYQIRTKSSKSIHDWRKNQDEWFVRKIELNDLKMRSVQKKAIK